MYKKHFIHNRQLQDYAVKKRNIETAKMLGEANINMQPSGIATMSSNRLNIVTGSEMAHIISNTIGRQPTASATEDFSSTYARIFAELSMNNIGDLTAKRNISQNMIDRAILFSNTYSVTREVMNKEQALASIGNFEKYMDKSNAMGAYFLDTETLGGQWNGKQRFDMITEYAIEQYDSQQNSIGKVSHLIGIEKEKIDKYRELLAGYSPEDPNDFRTITMKHFARLGHEASEYSEGADGRWTGKLVDGETEDLFTPENIERGMKRSTEMYDAQQKTIDGSGKTLWQRDMSHWMQKLQKDAASGKAVIGGHNQTVYDYDVFGKSMGSPLSIPKEMSFDVLAMARLSDQGGSFAEEFYGNQKILKGKSIYTQEAMYRRLISLLPESEQKVALDELNAAHMADFDQWVSHKIATMSLPTADGPRSLLSIFKQDISRLPDSTPRINIGNNNSLIHITEGLGGSRLGNNLLGFTFDPFDQKIHTHDGYEVGADGLGSTSKFNATWLAKKGVNYVPNSYQLKDNQALFSALQKVYPGMDNNGMFVLELTPDNFGNETGENLFKTQQKSFILGTKQDIEKRLNEVAIPVASKIDGKIVPFVPGLDLVRPHYQGETNLGTYEGILDEIRRMGAETNANDTAARFLRGADPKKFQALETVRQAIAQQTQLNMQGGAAADVARKNALKQLQNSTMQIAGKIAKGGSLTIPGQAGAIKSMQELTGWGSKPGSSMLYNTYDNIVASLGHYESIAAHVQVLQNLIADKTKNMGRGEGEEYGKFLFEQGMSMFYNKAEQILPVRPDKKTTPVRGYENAPYEIDISSIKKKSLWQHDYNDEFRTPDDILSVGLKRNGSYSLLDEIENKLAGGGSSAVKEVEERKRLVQVAALEGLDFSGEKYAGMDNQVMARTFVSEMRARRRGDIDAGRAGGKRMMDSILGASDLANVSVEEMTKTWEQLKSPTFSYSNLGKLSSADDVNAQAKLFVDKFLAYGLPSQQVINKGLTNRQQKILETLESTHRKDLLKYAETFMGGLKDSGFGLIYDPETGYAAIRDVEKKASYDISGMLPKLRYMDGTFFTEIGHKNVKANLELMSGPANNLVGGARLSSHVGLAQKKAYKLSTMISNKIKNGEDPAEAINLWVGQIAREVRNLADVKFAPQDNKLQFETGISDIVDNLGAFLDTPEFSLIPAADREILKKMTKKKGYSHERLSSHTKDLLSRNYPALAQIFQGPGVNHSVSFMASGWQAGAKKSSMENFALRSDDSVESMETLVKYARDIENTRVREFDADAAKRELEAKGMGHVRPRNPLLTALGERNRNRTLDNTSIHTTTELQVNRAFYTEQGLKEKIHYELEKQLRLLDPVKDKEQIASLKAAVERIRMAGHTATEGAIANEALLNSATGIYDYQKVPMHEIIKSQLSLEDLKHNGQKISEELMNVADVIPKFEMVNGEMQLTYKKGRFIKEGETVLSLVGYGNSVEHEIAKNTGFVKMGFFAKKRNILVSEQDVVKAVGAKHGNITNQDQFMQVAQQMFNAYIYVEDAEKNIFRKTSENMSEKHMTTFLSFGIGESKNTAIRTTMKELGFSGLVKRGTVLSDSLFGDLASEQGLATGMLKNLADPTNSLNSVDAIHKVITRNFSSIDEFYKALQGERSMPSRFLRQATGADYIVSSDIVKHETRADAIVTGLMGAVRNVEKDLLGKGLKPGEAYNTAVERVARDAELANFMRNGKTSAIHYDKNTKSFRLDPFLFDKDGELRGKEADVFFQKYGVKLNSIYDEGNVMPAMMGFVEDWTGRTSKSDNLDVGKGAKVSDREINNMELAIYDQKYIDRMQAKMGKEEFAEMFGNKVSYAESGKAVLREDLKGQAILKPLLDSYRGQLWYKTGEDELTESLIAASGGELDHLSQFVSKSYKEASGIDKISVKKAHELYSAVTGAGAVLFNSGKMSRESLENHSAWKIISSGDIDLATGRDYDLLSRNPNSVIGKNILLDLKNDEAFGEEFVRNNMLNGTDGLLAINRPPDSRIGDEAVLGKQYGSLNKLMRARNNLLAARADNDQAGIQKEEANAAAAISEFREYQDAAVYGNKGYLSEAGKIELGYSFSGKASVTSLADKEDIESKALRNIKINGKGLYEHQKNGAYYDVKVVSREAFEKAGMFKTEYMQDVLGKEAEGLSTEQMESRVSNIYRSEGFLGMTHRFPTIYHGSMRGTQVFMSDDLKNAQMVSMAHGAIYSKTDADGDLEYLMKVMGGHNGKAYDSLQAKHLTGEAAKVATVEQNAVKESYARAAYLENEMGAKAAAEDLAMANDVDKLFGASSISDALYPRSSKFITPGELAQHQGTFDKWNETAVQKAMAERSETHEVVEAAFRTDKTTHVAYLRQAMDAASENDHRSVQAVLNSLEERAVSIGKGRQSSAGEISLAAFKGRKMRQMTQVADGTTFSQDELNIFDSVMEAMEEGFLSPKHADRTIVENVGIADQFHKINRSLAAGEKGADENMINWLEENAKSRVRKVNLYNIQGEVIAAKGELEEIKSEHIRTSVDMMKKMFSTLENVNRFNDSMMVGASRYGVSEEATLNALVFSKETKDTLSSKVSKAVSSSLGYDFGEMSATSRRVQKSSYEEAFEAAEEAGMNRPGFDATSIVSNLADGSVFKSSGGGIGKKLAIGAVGVAASLMVAGFVGGNPSQPADGQAMQEQSQEDNYSIPSLTATNQLTAQGGPQAGYVININAQTNQGRAHAERAIKQAMASQSRSKVNIAMNIREDSGNINMNGIESMIEGALG